MENKKTPLKFNKKTWLVSGVLTFLFLFFLAIGTFGFSLGWFTGLTSGLIWGLIVGLIIGIIDGTLRE